MVLKNEVKFGDVLLYAGRTGRLTPCIYVRQQTEAVAVVLFEHATTVAKVKFDRLTRPSACSVEIDKLFDEYV